MRPLVLCYHAVSDAFPDQLAVGTRAFERHLRSLLRLGYRSVGATEVVGGSGRIMHVTFDDAYRTLIPNALPVMERLGVRATVFACSGYAVDGRPLDVPEIAALLPAHGQEMATMTWDELRELADRGVAVGSHTVSHPHLPRLTDHELEAELRDSREAIEDQLGRRCAVLAYPFGDDDPRVHRMSARVGYDAAFSLAAKPHASARNRYAVPRVDLYRQDGALRSALKVSPLRPALAPLAHRVGGLRRAAAR